MVATAPGGFQWGPGDLDAVAALPAGSIALTAVEMVVYQSWQASRRNVARIDAVQQTVALKEPCAIEIEPHANSGRCGTAFPGLNELLAYCFTRADTLHS